MSIWNTTMRFKIVTPEQILLEAEGEAVYAYGPEGRFGVLKGHVPLVAVLEVGVLCYFIGGKRHCAAIMGGLLRTDGHDVLVLSPIAEKGEDIDVIRAEQAKQRAEERLRAQQRDTETQRAELALARALTRIKAAHGLFSS